jgi:hypothetical protein
MNGRRLSRRTELVREREREESIAAEREKESPLLLPPAALPESHPPNPQLNASPPPHHLNFPSTSNPNHKTAPPGRTRRPALVARVGTRAVALAR